MGRSRWGSSRRRSSKANAAALALAVTAVLALITAGVFLIAAIARAIRDAVARQRQARAERDATTGFEAPDFGRDEPATPVAVAPDGPEAYHEVCSIAPETFDHPLDIEREGRRVFAAWARRLPGAPRDASDRIEQIAPRVTRVGRLVTTLAGRRFVWKARAAAGHDAPGKPAIDVATLDPWHPPPDLEVGTRHTVACRRCQGHGRLACGTCGGAGRVMCATCHGARKYHQLASNGARRLMNCRACQAKGDVGCSACHAGRVRCPGCDGHGRLLAWLEIDESGREDVQVEPDGDVTRAFWWGTDGVRASDEAVAVDARAICAVESPRKLVVADLPDAVPADWQAAHWRGIQAQVQAGEHVVRQRFALLEVPSVDVTYVVGNERQTVVFEGRRMLAPPASDEVAFARRGGLLRMARFGLLALPVGLGLVYLARGAWFLSAEVAIVVGCATAAALLAYLALWHATLPRSGAWAWLGATALPLVGGVVFAFGAEPSLERARAALAAGEVEVAAAELAAIGAGTDDAEVARTQRELALRRVLGETDPDRAAALLLQVAPGSAEAADALAHVDGLCFVAARDATDAGRYDEAQRWLAKLSDPRRSAPDTRDLAEQNRVARDDQVLAQTRLSLARGDVAEARVFFARLSVEGEQTPERRALAGAIAIAAGRAAIDASAWSTALASAQEAEAAGFVAEAAALREAANAAMDQRARELVDTARKTKDLEARIAAQEAAERGLVQMADVRQAPAPRELGALRKQHTKDVQTLTRRRAAEERKRAEAQRKADAAQLRAERRAAAQARQRAAAPSYRSRPQCRTGCPCGNSCISCSKRCRR